MKILKINYFLTRKIMDVKIAPSILSADFGELNADIKTVEDVGADLLHVDVMDGHFVPNISIGPCVVRKIKSGLPLHVHLMISEPEKYVEEFAKAGAAKVIFHVEACEDCVVLIEKIKGLGCEAGVSLKPGTAVSTIKDFLSELDEVLVMTVEPGFGGQSFMEDMVGKICELREAGFEGDIAVDGGINAETGKVCREAGANILIAGSYIFKADDRGKAIESLKG